MISASLNCLIEWAAGLFRRHRAAIVDAVILLVGLVLLSMAVLTGKQDGLVSGTFAQVSWQIDESLVFIIGVCAALAFYALRRVMELHREVNRRAAAEQRLIQLAHYDGLTGLPNRRLLADSFEDLRRHAMRRSAELGMYVVNVDRFKSINEFHGHSVGDEVLREMACRLERLMRKEHLLVRLDGDEFAILAEFKPGSDGPLRLARRITCNLALPVAVHGKSLSLTASVGIALHAAGRVSDLETLIRQAEVALSRAKDGERGTHHFLEQEMDETLRERIALQPQLRPAIEGGQIVPYYQPLVELRTQTVVGFEVLARWRHPVHGVIAPASFVPLAEDTGLISELTYALLRQACGDARQLPPHTFLSVNLSPEQLSDRWLPHKVLGVLSETGFPANRLELEITEHALVEKLEDVRAVLQSLRNLGVGIVLDDFGTGYSSLYHLRELKLDKLKIDRSFIAEIRSDPEQARIVEAIMSMSDKLGLRTTAEGIETAAVCERVAELGCHIGQSFYFGRPMPFDELAHGSAVERLPRPGHAAFQGAA